MRFILASLIMISTTQIAIASFRSTECTAVERARLELYAHARNALQIAEKQNMKRQVVSCEKGTGRCSVYSTDDSPVSAQAETDAFTIKAAEIRGLAHSGLCGTSIVENGTSALVQFSDEVGGGSEVLNFFDNGKVVSWSRDSAIAKLFY